MFKRILPIIMVLAVASIATASTQCDIHRNGKGFKGYSSVASGKPCPGPGPEMKQGGGPCKKGCKHCEKCPQGKGCGQQKQHMKRMHDGKAPCFAAMTSAAMP
jgi:hypothetical protein